MHNYEKINSVAEVLYSAIKRVKFGPLLYLLIASVFTREKRDKGEIGLGKTGMDFCATNLENLAFNFKICRLAYCFHSNTWRNLLSNLFELVSKKLSVFCGFD